MSRIPRLARAAVPALAAALLPAGCGGSGGGGSQAAAVPIPVSVPQAYRPSGHAAAGDVFVQLFEWTWPDVARECEQWLGPKGYRAVQVSPPNEHAVIGGYPWWQRYQPVSYRLDRSRSGTLAQFQDMVARCAAVGVDIYADAVVNHMAADSGILGGVGSAGSPYQKYAYPAVPYGASDFHLPCAVSNYQDAANVQDCELSGLADLRTEAASVRARVAAYLVAMNAMGVAGFRIDAAKHVPAADLDAILAQVDAAAAAAGRAAPYVFLEIIDNPAEAVTPRQYYGVGYVSGGAADITEFLYGYRVSDVFLGRNGATMAGLLPAALDAGLMPSDKAVVFTDNHDNQRSGNIRYADTAYELAVAFTLAQPQGYPVVMSSYGFDLATQAGRDSGPPSSGAGVTSSTFDAAGNSACTAQLGSQQVGRWICEHRRPAIAAMVGFRRYTASAPGGAWQSPAPSTLAFARTGMGFFAVNTGTSDVTASFQTTLPAGSYCDVFGGSFDAVARTCTTTPVAIAADGSATIRVPAGAAVALHGGARL